MSPVSSADALAAWVVEARPVLERIAKTYHATITYKDLAEGVQVESGIRTRRLLQHWIGDVLGTVAHDCQTAGEPLLSSLCVRADGTVGPGYAVAGSRLTTWTCMLQRNGSSVTGISEPRCPPMAGALRSPSKWPLHVSEQNNGRHQRIRPDPSVQPAISCCPSRGNATTARRSGNRWIDLKRMHRWTKLNDRQVALLRRIGDGAAVTSADTAIILSA
jgi:hypothetical protein